MTNRSGIRRATLLEKPSILRKLSTPSRTIFLVINLSQCVCSLIFVLSLAEMEIISSQQPVKWFPMGRKPRSQHGSPYRSQPRASGMASGVGFGKAVWGCSIPQQEQVLRLARSTHCGEQTHLKWLLPRGRLPAAALDCPFLFLLK